MKNHWLAKRDWEERQHMKEWTNKVLEPFDFSAGLYNEVESFLKETIELMLNLPENKSGDWDHITVVVDAGRQETYVNGELMDVKVFGEALSEEEIGAFLA